MDLSFFEGVDTFYFEDVNQLIRGHTKGTNSFKDSLKDSLGMITIGVCISASSEGFFLARTPCWGAWLALQVTQSV